MADRVFTAIFTPTEDWWAAGIEELPGVNTQGRTLDEARENVQAALIEMLDILRVEAQEFGESEKTVREQITLKAS